MFSFIAAEKTNYPVAAMCATPAVAAACCSRDDAGRYMADKATKRLMWGYNEVPSSSLRPRPTRPP